MGGGNPSSSSSSSSVYKVVGVASNPLDIDREGVVGDLFFVLLVPLVGAEGLGGLLEVVAVLVALAADLQTPLVVHVVDETVLGLILVGEPRVPLRRPQGLLVEVLGQALANAGREHGLPFVRKHRVDFSLKISS